MAGNETFELVSERGWRRGLGNMLRNELGHWWATRMWWVQSLIWVVMIGFLLGAILFSSPTTPPGDEVAILFSIFAGLFPAVGVVIIMQSAVVGEKEKARPPGCFPSRLRAQPSSSPRCSPAAWASWQPWWFCQVAWLTHLKPSLLERPGMCRGSWQEWG